MQKYLSGSRMVCRVGFVVVLAAALTHAATDCFADPTQAGCADDSVVAYNATADLESLCKKMPYMPGCSVGSACKNKDLSGDYCTNWSLLSNTCSVKYGEMMTGMKGCENYLKLCKEGTKVKGCETGIPNLITTANLKKDTAAACTAAADTISACANCKTEPKVQAECPDPLSALSAACAKASDSEPCKSLKKMCDGAKGLDLYCGKSTSGGSILSAAAAATLAVAAASAVLVMA